MSEDSFDVNHTIPIRKPKAAPLHERNLSIGSIMHHLQPNGTDTTRQQRSGTIADYNEAYNKETELIQQLQANSEQLLDNDTELDAIDFDSIENDSLLHNVLTDTVDLRIFSAENSSKLHAVESALLQQCIANAGNYCNLYGHIQQCSTVLTDMQQMLYGYQNDLTQISHEINTLQNSTKVITQKLNNRKQSQTLLSNTISTLYVTDDLIYTILNTELISEYFMAGLKVLSSRIQYFDTQKQLNFNVKLYGEMYSIVNKLKLKAVQRIRTFFMERFSELQNPKINLSAEKTSYLIYNYYILFLYQHADTNVYTELQQYYTETITKIYSRKFTHLLQQYKTHIRAQLWANDTIVNEHTVKQDSSASVFASKARKSRATLTEQFAFTQAYVDALHINYNETVLTYDSKKPCELYQFYGYLLNLLVESVNNELLFLVHFWNYRSVELTELVCDDHTLKLCNNIFSAVYENITASLVEHVERAEYYDFHNVLLLIYYIFRYNTRIDAQNVKLQNCMQKLNSVLWKKLKTLFELHLTALRSYSNNKYSKDSDSYILQRFVHVINGITHCNTLIQTDILDSYALQFADAVYTMLTRVAPVKPEQKLLFMLYECMYVCNTMRSVHCDNTAVYNYYKDKYLAYLNQLIETVLTEYFGAMVQYISKYEKATEYSGVNTADIDSINAHFTEQYKPSIVRIEKYCAAHFPHDTQDENNVLSSILIQLLLYYQRYIDCITKIQQQLKCRQFTYISPSTLIYEIKRYTK